MGSSWIGMVADLRCAQSGRPLRYGLGNEDDTNSTGAGSSDGRNLQFVASVMAARRGDLCQLRRGAIGAVKDEAEMEASE